MSLQSQEYLNQIAALQEIQVQKARQKARHENPILAIRPAIEKQVREFENTLEDGFELGALLASFGNQILIIVESIEFSEPALIIFHGRDDSGNKLQLIQHVSQLNFLLTAVKRTTEEPRKKIGFIHD